MSISLCLMARNEEQKLAACLQSAADLVDEIVVVDTGSTDRTKEVAASFGAKVFDFRSFSWFPNSVWEPNPRNSVSRVDETEFRGSACPNRV